MKKKRRIMSSVNEKIYNIIRAITVAEIKEKILKCVSEEVITYEDCLIKDNDKLSDNAS